MSLRAEIRRLREQAGSHDKLAAQLGTTRQTVIRWEHGAFPRDYVAKLRALGVPEELLERPETPERLDQVEADVASLSDGLDQALDANRLLEERVLALEKAAAPGARRRKASTGREPPAE